MGAKGHNTSIVTNIILSEHKILHRRELIKIAIFFQNVCVTIYRHIYVTGGSRNGPEK